MTDGCMVTNIESQGEFLGADVGLIDVTHNVFNPKFLTLPEIFHEGVLLINILGFGIVQPFVDKITCTHVILKDDIW